MIDILNHWTRGVAFHSETATTIVEAVVEAINQGAYLQGADLRGADLQGAYLRGAYLGGADLGNQWIVQGQTRSRIHA